MRHFNHFLRWILSFSIAWTPFMSNAQNSPSNLSQEDKELVGWAQRTYGPVGWKVTVNHQQNMLIATPAQDAQGERVEIPLGSESELRKYSPSKISNLVKDFIKAARPGQTIKEQTIHLPGTSLAFAAGIGALTWLGLLTQHMTGAVSADPVSGQHAMDGAISPFGQFGLWTFAASQGMSMNVLQTFLREPKFQPYLPLMAMSVGFFVQSTISSFAADPSVQACVAQTLGNKSAGWSRYHNPGDEAAVDFTQYQDPQNPAQGNQNHGAWLKGAPMKAVNACDEAFSYYVVKNHISEMVPGLLAMVATFAVLAGGKWLGNQGLNSAKWLGTKAFETPAGKALLSKGAEVGKVGSAGVRWLGTNVLRMETVEIAVTLTPDGWAMTFGKFLMMGAQMALFTAISNDMFQQPLTTAWKNYADGGHLTTLETELEHQLEAMKASGWSLPMNPQSCSALQRNSNCQHDLAWTLKETQNQMAAWRMMNMSDVYQANANWASLLAQFTGRYNVAFSYYRDFIDEARNSKYNFTSPKRLEIPYPLLGVQPDGVLKNVEQDPQLQKYMEPLATEDHASEHATAVGQWLKAQILSHEQQMWVTGSEKEFLAQVALDLLSGKPETQGSAIYRMKLQIPLDSWSGYLTSGEFTKTMKEAMIRLAGDDKTGVPSPMMAPGQGFATAFERWSPVALAGEINELQKPRTTGPFRTPNFTDHLLVQMICGPDVEKQGSIIGQMSWGYPLNFRSPQIVNAGWDQKVCGPAWKGALTTMKIFDEEDGTLIYRPGKWAGDKAAPVSLVQLAKNAIRPEIFGDANNSGFDLWWQKNVSTQMKSALDQFEIQYDTFIVKMIQELDPKRESLWKVANRGPVENQGIPALRQAYRLNLVILGELFKDGYRRTHNGQDIPMTAQYFSPRREPAPQVPAQEMLNFNLTKNIAMLSEANHGFPLIKALHLQDVANPHLNVVDRSILEWDSLVALQPNSSAHRMAHLPRGVALKFQRDIEASMELLIAELGKLQPTKVDDHMRVISHMDEDALAAGLKQVQDEVWRTAALFGLALPRTGEDGTVENPPPAALVIHGELEETVRVALNSTLEIANEIVHLGAIADAVSFDRLSQSKKLAETQKGFNTKVAQALKACQPLMIGAGNRGTGLDKKEQ